MSKVNEVGLAKGCICSLGNAREKNPNASNKSRTTGLPMTGSKVQR